MSKMITLGEAIDFLTTADSENLSNIPVYKKEIQEKTLLLSPVKFENPHSYRGFYDQLALEARNEEQTLSELLNILLDALNEEFSGYKGGVYKMHENVNLYLALEGHCSNKIISQFKTTEVKDLGTILVVEVVNYLEDSNIEKLMEEENKIDRSYGCAKEVEQLDVEVNFDKEYWGAASTRNCVWLYQEKVDDLRGSFWLTRGVFLTPNEARAWGNVINNSPVEKEYEDWRIWGVPCRGSMAFIINQHLEDNGHHKTLKEIVDKELHSGE